MVDWFVEQYAPGFKSQLGKETDEKFPSDPDDPFGSSEGYNYWLEKLYATYDKVMVVIGAGDPWAEVGEQVSLTWLENFIQNLHFEYYDAKGLFTSLYGGEGRAPKEWVGERPAKGARFEILKRDNYRCQVCGASAADGVKLQIDHVRPKAKGGSSFVWNLWVLCEPCNNGKRARDL